MKRHLRAGLSLNLLLVLVALVGMWKFGSGFYIHAKAELAQYLLERAWEGAGASDGEVKPWPWADTYPVARLRVPGQGVDQVVLAGISGRTLAFGPGYMLASAAPGAGGSTVLSGHRDTHFRFLEYLKPGDLLSLETADGSISDFVVADATVTDVRSSNLKLDFREPSLVLVTCYPFGVLAPAGPLRYVVTARPPTRLSEAR